MSDSAASPGPAADTSRSARMIRALLVLTAVAGMFICAVLLRLTVAGTDRAVLDAWCAPTSEVNCAHVLASRWSKIGFIPTAQLGLIYFACAAVWYVVIGIPNRRGRAWHLVPILLTGIGLLGSGFFLFVMSRLPVWCTWCGAAHVANFFLFALAVVGWFAASGGGEPRPTGAKVGAVVCASAVVGLILVLGGAAYRQQHAAAQLRKLYMELTNDVDYVVWRHASAPYHDIPIRDDDLELGPADAPHTLVIFSDFECDECAKLHSDGNIFALAATFPESLRAVFRHYPVCRACNPHVDVDFHFFSCDAALAAEAARRCGDETQALRFWKLLYANRERLDEAPYAELAKSAGLDPSAFEEARRDDATRARVDEDIELAHRLDVEGTPALFLDGRRLPQWGIVKPDLSGTPDKDATLRLWRTLLGVDGSATPSQD